MVYLARTEGVKDWLLTDGGKEWLRARGQEIGRDKDWAELAAERGLTADRGWTRLATGRRGKSGCRVRRRTIGCRQMPDETGYRQRLARIGCRQIPDRGQMLDATDYRKIMTTVCRQITDCKQIADCRQMLDEMSC